MSSHAKSVVVTGGAGGIGLAIATHYASQGHHVAILDINRSAGQAAQQAILKDHPEAKLAFKQCSERGHIDVVVANAGIAESFKFVHSATTNANPSKPDFKTLDINLIGALYRIHYLSKNDATDSKGSIVTVASDAGIYPFPAGPIYATSKHGIVGLVRALAPPLERKGIRINGLCPCVIETNLAPDRVLFENMVLTPMSTLIRAVVDFDQNPSTTGQLAELHGDNVTIVPPRPYVDEDTRKNMEMFWTLGYS
ncbi:hypothetical protein LTR10_022465 [Elasticomyces elasticus]|uniref:NAD(P)-binding protein n=1 Tax=Exophiala sideris TaxID=1016849 RepID=A0ABR0J3Z2_9EURO|nr:hypothetical protein LTR10_022465 [Elasticomyces elasticus]KAK5024902.1 hypothetical protein LTS07_008280 [Exophiala sideris]KAK5054941.1 hypothetical protein LTR69_008509 [Exophiala sideris]KAK5179820.1 hypothetical protein LTR44_007636 [Eurotiomycetes sp. CCFEE 6388]